MALSPGSRLGVYEVTARIGEGGMGQVYRATDTRLKRQVAIKILPPALAADSDRLVRFQREAEVLASLNHPNIAHIHGLEESGGITALVMELVEGEDLAQRIARGAIPVDEALPIAKQIGEALEVAHQQGIIHRDLKPANIKVRPDGTVKVLDFGLAKAMEPVGSAPNVSQSPTITTPAMTHAGMILGTAPYMSPEQARGKPVDKRADIWAFGAVLFEMLCGKRAFAGDVVSEVLASVLAREPDWERLPASLSPTLGTCIRRCLHKDPRQRIHDMADVRLVLDGAFETAVPLPTAPATSSAPRGRLAWMTALAVAAAAIVAVAIPAVRHLRETPPVQQSYRFQIAPPAHTSFSTFRLSPDGRYVAYIAVGGQAAARALWIHEFDSLDSRRIPGSEGASYPFWSPDSAFIGFFQGGKLKKVAATGGPAQPICDVGDSRGGAWGPDGTILFSDGPASPILRVPSTGGKPAPLTTLTGGDPGEGHRAPEFLPDGQHFLFLARGNNIDNTGIQLGSLDGSAPMRLLPDDSNGIYIPRVGVAGGEAEGGHLFFLRTGTLMALPLDSTQWKPTAEAFPVAENVGIASNQRYGAFSLAGNGALAYWGNGGVANNRELVWMDRSGKRLNPVSEPREFGPSVALSPDEKTVAVTMGNPQQADIWLLDSASGSDSRFTFGFTGFGPVWSSDGTFIIYARRNGATNDIARRPIAGGADELLLANIINATPRDVSADGKFIVHDMSVAKAGFDIGLLVAADGGHRESVYLSSAANERAARFSPDGKWMAYESDESGQSPQVYVQTIPTGGRKFLISASGGTIPAWRHDGKELYYLAPDQKLMAVPVKINGPSFEYGPPHALFSATGASSFDVTRDGQRFLMNVPAGGESAASGPPLTIVTNWHAGLKK